VADTGAYQWVQGFYPMAMALCDGMALGYSVDLIWSPSLAQVVGLLFRGLRIAALDAHGCHAANVFCVL
jgi:hypothetical protein